MKKLSIQQCADSGSQFCPCHLAYSGDCIRCNMINGNNICDCAWQGVCVYSEVKHNKKQITDLRKEYLCNIENIKEIKDNTYLLSIKIPKEIAKDLLSPGAYIMLKSIDRVSDIFNAPISVMDVDIDREILQVVIKPRGIKTKGIINFNQVYLKGPYFNGIFGIKEIKTTQNSNCLVIVSGLSQVNAINVIRRLITNNNKVEVLINNRGSLLDEVVQKIMDLGVSIYEIDASKDKDFIIDYIIRNEIEFVYSGASHRFSKEVMDIVDSVDKNIKLAISNNNLICCGEGVCGACTVNINGQRVKTCKSQVDSRDYLNSL